MVGYGGRTQNGYGVESLLVIAVLRETEELTGAFGFQKNSAGPGYYSGGDTVKRRMACQRRARGLGCECLPANLSAALAAVDTGSRDSTVVLYKFWGPRS